MILQAHQPDFEAFCKTARNILQEPKIILFGSRHLGCNRLDSDIDILVLSDSFKGLGLVERMQLIRPAKKELKWLPCDLLAHPEDEWARQGYWQRMIESQHREPDWWRELKKTLKYKEQYNFETLLLRDGRPLPVPSTAVCSGDAKNQSDVASASSTCQSETTDSKADCLP